MTLFSDIFSVLGISSSKPMFDAIAMACTFLLLPPLLGNCRKSVVRGYEMRKNPRSWRWRRTLVGRMSSDGYSGAWIPRWSSGYISPLHFPWKCFPEDIFLIHRVQHKHDEQASVMANAVSAVSTGAFLELSSASSHNRLNTLFYQRTPFLHALESHYY